MAINRTYALWGLGPKDLAKIAAIGLAGGLMSGLLGVNGGLVLVPALVFILDWDQKQAQGTSLAATLPPVTILAVSDYYVQGQVNLRAPSSWPWASLSAATSGAGGPAGCRRPGCAGFSACSS